MGNRLSGKKAFVTAAGQGNSQLGGQSRTELTAHQSRDIPPGLGQEQPSLAISALASSSAPVPGDRTPTSDSVTQA